MSVPFENFGHIARSVEEARSAGERYREAREELKRDPRYSDEGRAVVALSLRERALDDVERHRAAAMRARNQLKQAVAAVEREHAPDPMAKVGHSIDRQRVRALLDTGTSPHIILDRASEQGDLATLQALRAELPWQGAPENDQMELGQFNRRITEASLPLLPIRLADARRAQLRLEQEWPAAQVWLDSSIADLDTGPSLATAITANYAPMATASPRGA